MDTDDLSREAYKAVIIEADKLSPDLTLQYGVLSGVCKNETEYLEKAGQLTLEIMNFDEIDLEDLFWDDQPTKEKLDFTLKKSSATLKRSNKFHLKNGILTFKSKLSKLVLHVRVSF